LKLKTLKTSDTADTLRILSNLLIVVKTQEKFAASGPRPVNAPEETIALIHMIRVRRQEDTQGAMGLGRTAEVQDPERGAARALVDGKAVEKEAAESARDPAKDLETRGEDQVPRDLGVPADRDIHAVPGGLVVVGREDEAKVRGTPEANAAREANLDIGPAQEDHDHQEAQDAQEVPEVLPAQLYLQELKRKRTRRMRKSRRP
jgi:hypothetical protein